MDYTRLPLLALYLFLTAVPLAASDCFAADLRPDRHRERLVVVHSDNTPPLSFKGLDGGPKGMIYDFWSAWSATTGIPVDFVQTDWANSLRMMREGTADVHGGLYYTDERAGYLEFSHPLFVQEATLFVRASLGIRSFSGIGDRYVAVLAKGYSETWLREHHPELNQRPYKNSRQMVEGALAGEVDALLTEYTTMVYQLGATGQYKDFVPLGTMYTQTILGAVRRGRSDLLAVVNHGIYDMGEEGRNKVFDRWIIHDDSFPSWLLPALGVGIIALMVGLGAVLAGNRRSR